jgi:hypothetical protein
MIRFNCPDCDRRIESDDSAAGLPIRCPHCHSPIEVPRGPHVDDAPRPPEPEREPPAERGPVKITPPDKPGPCLFCTDPQGDVRTAFVRLRNRRIQGYLQCRCCERCYGAVNAWDWLRLWIMGIALGALAFAFCAGIPIAAVVGGKDKEHSTPLQTTVAISVLVLPMAGFFLTPIFLFFFRGHRAAKIMHPATNGLLKRLLGTPWWGLGNHAWMVREPPPGEPYLEFQER